ncbi:hypothetical protein [Luteitalea sp.]
MTAGARGGSLRTVLALAFPPLLVTSLMLMYVVDVPHWDTWDWLDRHYPAAGDHGGLLQRYWTLFNGHRVFLPLLLDRLLFDLSSIDVLPRIWLKPLLAAATLWPLVTLLRVTSPAGVAWPIHALVGALTFPLAYGPMWIDPRQFSLHLVVLTVTAALAIAASARPPVTRVVLTALLCSAAAVSYGPGALAWPFVWLVLCAHRPRPAWPWLVVWLMAPLVLVLSQVTTLAEMSTLDTTRPSTLAAAVHGSAAVAGLAVAPSGSMFGYRLARVAGVGGVLLVLAAAGLTGRADRDVRQRALPWLALAGWGVAYVCSVGFTRGGLPLPALHDPRFAVASALIWLPALILLCVVFGPHGADGAQYRVAVVAHGLLGGVLIGALVAGAHSSFGPEGLATVSRRLRAGRACLAAYRTADDSCLRLIYVEPDRLRSIAARLDARGATFMRVAREATHTEADENAALHEQESTQDHRVVPEE